MAQFAVILPAAGKSTRFGGPQKKTFIDLDGRPLWMHAVERFVKRDDVTQTIIVIAADDREWFLARYAANLMFLGVEIADGGGERFESVENALNLVRDEVTHVAVHDAVRPLTPTGVIDAAFAAAVEHGAALPGSAVADTLKRVDDAGRVTATVPRAGLWRAQTPQAFRKDWLVGAYGRRHSLSDAVTDDAQLVEAVGRPVIMTVGAAENFKVTTPDDMRLAEALLAAENRPNSRPAGHPFDDEQY